MASRIGLLRPERLLAFTAKGFTLGRPLNARSRVDALIERMAALVLPMRFLIIREPLASSMK
jgi:hypothetical protein